MKKIEIGGRLYNVTQMDNYTSVPDLYNPRFTAIERPNENIVLPIRSRATDTEPGIYYQPNSMASIVIKPDNIEEYSMDKIIDFSNSESISDIFEKQQIIRDIQDEIMTTSDNILQLKISDNDTPEMKALKTAINLKRIDPKQYEHRFPQYQNDMRLINKGKSITLGKLVSIGAACDIAVEITLKDKYNDVPNPMNQTIVIDLTEGRD